MKNRIEEIRNAKGIRQDELAKLIFEGKIQDAKTVSAVMAYYYRFKNSNL